MQIVKIQVSEQPILQKRKGGPVDLGFMNLNGLALRWLGGSRRHCYLLRSHLQSLGLSAIEPGRHPVMVS